MNPEDIWPNRTTPENNSADNVKDVETQPETKKENPRKLEPDFISTFYSEAEYDLKMALEELRRAKDPESVQIGNHDELEKKYGTYQEYLKRSQEIKLLEKELVEAIGKKDDKKFQELRKIYESRFPSQIEGVEGLLSLDEHFNNQNRIDEIQAERITVRKKMDDLDQEIETLRKQIKDAKQKNSEKEVVRNLQNEELTKRNEFEKIFAENKKKKNERQELIVETAAYQALLTDFTKNNPNKREFLENFWELARKIGQAKGDVKAVERLRAGVLSQVAIFHTLDKLGLQPHIAHPEKDAKNQIDFETNQGFAQAKGTPGIREIKEISEGKIEEKDDMVMPSMTIEGPNGTTRFTDVFNQQFSEFREKIEDYNKRHKTNERAFMMAIPHNQMHPDTGVPDESYVEYARVKLHEILESKTAVNKVLKI